MPHRAYVLRRHPDRRRARDDPGRRRKGPSRGAGQDRAVPEVGLRRTVRDHGRPAGDGAPAGPAVARVHSPHRGRHRRPGRLVGHRRREAEASRQGTARDQPDAGPPRLPAGRRLSRNLRDAGPRHHRGGAGGQAEIGRRAPAGDHASAGRPGPGDEISARADRPHGQGGVRGDGPEPRLSGRHDDRTAASSHPRG